MNVDQRALEVAMASGSRKLIARANDLQALISNNQWQEAQELLYAMSQQVGAMKKLANRLSPSSLAHELVSHIDI